MIKSNVFRLFATGVAFSLTTLCAQSQKEELNLISAQKQNSPLQSSHTMSPSDFPSPSADITTFVQGDLLYWTSRVDGMDYLELLLVPLLGLNEKTRVVEQTDHVVLPWTANFRVGAGFYFPKNEAKTTLNFTYFKSGHSNPGQFERDDSVGTAFAGVDVIRLWALATGGKVQSCKGRFSVNYYAFDFDVSKVIWKRKYATLEPLLGIRWARVEQKLNIVSDSQDGAFTAGYNHASSSNQNILNRFTGAGLRFGSGFNLIPHERFTIYSNFFVALLVGKFRLNQDEEFRPALGLPPTQWPYPLTASSVMQRFSIKPNYILNLGMIYTQPFANGRSLKVKAGYEFDIWPNQREVPKFLPETTNGTAPYAREGGDISFDGLVLNMEYMF